MNRLLFGDCAHGADVVDEIFYLNGGQSARKEPVRIFLVSFAATDGGEQIVVGALLHCNGLEIWDVGLLSEVGVSGQIAAVASNTMLGEEGFTSALCRADGTDD